MGQGGGGDGGGGVLVVPWRNVAGGKGCGRVRQLVATIGVTRNKVFVC